MFSNTRGLFNGGDGAARHPPAKFRHPDGGFVWGSSGLFRMESWKTVPAAKYISWTYISVTSPV